jgi:hypothetical protein
MNDNVIDEYTRRPARYGQLDGTSDLEFGIWFLVFGLGIRLSAVAKFTSIWYFLAASQGIIVAVGIATYFGGRLLRRRLVYPRSGYVRFPKRPWVAACVALAAAIVSAATAWYFAKGSAGISAPFAAGLFISLGMLVGALRNRVRKLAAYAGLSIAIGLVLQFTDPTFVSGSSRYYFLMGAALLLNGALTLYLYVRRTPRQAEAEG